MTAPPVRVLFEDNHLLVVEKPAGMLTQPTPETDESLEMLLKAWLKEKYQKPGNVFLGVVHRLDKPVGGIVVFAKTSKALSRLNESMRQGLFHKIYTATVEGSMPASEGFLENYLIHDDYKAEVVNEGNSRRQTIPFALPRSEDTGCFVRCGNRAENGPLSSNSGPMRRRRLSYRRR